MLTSCSESLYEDEAFPERQLAALVLAKAYYHLQEYNESMMFALSAGDLFQLDKKGEFEETIISRCVDTYINVCSARHVAPTQLSQAGALPILATSFVNGTDDANATAALSPTTPFSQAVLPSKSLLSRENTLSEDAPQPGKLKSGLPMPDRSTQAALEKIIERLFESCMVEGRYRQVVGIALEAKNLEVLKRVVCNGLA
jgi:26S proteasome regulatory subunit N2